MARPSKLGEPAPLSPEEIAELERLHEMRHAELLARNALPSLLLSLAQARAEVERVREGLKEIALGTGKSPRGVVTVPAPEPREPADQELDALADIIDGEVGDTRPMHMERCVWRFVVRCISLNSNEHQDMTDG